MATADLKLIYGGGSFKPTFFSGMLNVPSGATGTVLSISAPAGKKVRLLSLSILSGVETGIQVSTDTGIVIGPLNLVGSANDVSPGRFNVGLASTSQGSCSISYVESTTSIIVEKASGSTSNTITYTYAFGD